MTPIVLVGEALGAEEYRIGQGFVGPSGVELLRQLHEAKILELTDDDRKRISRYYDRGDTHAVNAIWQDHSANIFRTNVFNLHPPGNKLESLCGPKANAIEGFPSLGKSMYVDARYECEFERLGDELLSHNPNVVVCLGNTALWALAGQTGISKLRGTTLLSTHTVTGFKLLPTYHPAAVLRQWEVRPTTIMDLIKAKKESAHADIRRPNCAIWIEPSLTDIEQFVATHITNCGLLSTDIETAGTRITCIGFAPRRDLAIVIPFDDPRKPNKSYWSTANDERRCWTLVKDVLEDGSIPKLFHNSLYDVGFLLRSYGIRVMGCQEDSMLLHHARQPESLKGLGFLGSIYTNHGSWKHMRKKHETIKRDD